MKWLTQVQADQANRLSSTQKSENEVASASSASIERKKLETGFVKGATVLTCSHCLEHALIYIYTHALSLAGLGVHVSSLSASMNAIILAQVNLNQNNIHCCFFLGLGKG